MYSQRRDGGGGGGGRGEGFLWGGFACCCAGAGCYLLGRSYDAYVVQHHVLNSSDCGGTHIALGLLLSRCCLLFLN
jgi:hypothetical protein